MDNMSLDPASNEPARQPEAVAASLIGQRDPTDRPASTHRLVPPPLDQSQQRRRIRGSSFFSGWRSMPGTTPLTSQLALLISTTTTKVEIGSNAVRLRLRSLTWATGQPPSVRVDDEGAMTSAVRPIASLGQDFTLSRATPSAASEQFPELIGCPISRSFTTYCVCLELRSLPSTGVTRLPRCRVGGGALDCSCAGLRPPHKLDVQFSRIQLS